MGKEIHNGVPLIIIGKLVDKQSCPQTSSVLYGLVMKYEVVSVLEGEYTSPYIYVVHGAPELPRSTFNKYSGTLTRFDIGAKHKLQLKEKLKDNSSPFANVVDPYDDPSTRYLALKTDLASA